MFVAGAVSGVNTQSTSAAPILKLDYPLATWVPANANNYTVADRPDDYQVNMIVIHDIEGSVSSAIRAFQDPNRAGSAHYVIGYNGAVYQMVAEKDIAWHAGNWDYNSRAIGIEHEGYAAYAYYTAAEYRASAQLIASICSRWGVPLDRAHVIGHAEVPDPFHPGLFGGDSHHTDPGKYWKWTEYLDLARGYAAALPSPPHMGPQPEAAAEPGGVMLSWQPAQSCHDPIRTYTVSGPNLNVTLPATQTSLWIPGLSNGSSYAYTVTATNAEGSDSMTSNTAIPGSACATAGLTTSVPSPQLVGSLVQLRATSSGCSQPEYEFDIRMPNQQWTKQRWYMTGSGWTWNTAGWAAGTYQLRVMARQRSSGHDSDAYALQTFVLGGAACSSASLSPNVPAPQVRGTSVSFTASSTGCVSALYQFWLLSPGASKWVVVKNFSSGSTWTLDTSKYPAGNFQVGVRVKQASSPRSYDAYFISTYWVSPRAGCVVTGLSPSPAPPQVSGAAVTFTPTQAGCSHQYKFWILVPGGTWKVVQNYSSKSTWTWNTAGARPGMYQVGVWEGRSTSPSSYESYAISTFTVTAVTCGSTGTTASASSPQSPGASVTFDASVTGCPHPQYQYWLLRPGTSTWVSQTAYGGASWTWNTTGQALGIYQVGVWARNAGSSSAYEAYSMSTFQLAVPRCTSATLDVSPASPQAAGASVTLSAASAGCTGARYEFWAQGPDGVWKAVRGWSTSNTFTWDSTGAAPGDYNFAVWADAPGSSNDYDVYATAPFSLS